MLYQVEVITEQNERLVLSLQDPSSGYIVSAIDGLDPVKATIVSSNFASTDGEQYQASRREKRNIVLKLDLKSDYTHSSARELRTNLYRFLNPKQSVTLRFHMEGEVSVDIVGRVETLESPLFTKDPQVTCSILCFDPNFFDPTLVTINGTTGTDQLVLDYDGTVETGINLRVFANTAVPSLSIYNRISSTIHTLDFTSPLISGDVLNISTTPGAKSARLLRGNALSSVLYGVSPSSEWVKLFPGVNNLRVYAAGAAIPYTLEYNAKYGGL